MKRIFCITLVVVTLISTMVQAGDSDLGLSIKDAQEEALNKSTQSRMDDLDIKMKESLLKDAIEDANYLPFAGDTDSLVANKIKSQVAPFEAEVNLELAKKNKEDHIKDLELDSYKASLDILLIEKELEKENVKLKNLQEKLDMVKAQNSVGKATSNDVSTAEYSVSGKQIDIVKIEDRHKAAIFEFKKILNLPLDDSAINITDSISYLDLGEVDLNTTVLEAISVDTFVYEKEQSVKAKGMRLEITGEYYSQGASEYAEATFDLESAKIGLDDVKIDLEVNLRNKYNELLNKRDKVELAKSYEAVMLKFLDAAKVKYDLGVISKEELMNEEEKYLDSTYQEYSAAKDYSVAKGEFIRLMIR